MRISVLVLMPAIAVSFAVIPRNLASRSFVLFVEDNQGGEEDGLVLGGFDDHLNAFKSKYPTGELDYLAAARKRAEERTASQNAGAKDEEWKDLADEKEEKYGKIDDWENSQKEAGNMDSQILMFTEPPTEGEGEDGEDDEPKLLLF